MSISKTKFNTLKYLIFCFVILIVFYGFSTPKVEATMTLISATGPSDGTETTGPFKFTYKFKVTKEPSEKLTDRIILSYKVQIDGANAKVAVENMVQKDSYVFYNKTLGDALKETQPISVSWEDLLYRDGKAKKYTWFVSDYYEGVLSTKNFTLKNSRIGPGFYFIGKYKSGTVTEYYFIVHGPYKDITACDTAWETDKKSVIPPVDPAFLPCKELTEAPSQPGNEPTCTPPQTLDTTTNTCVDKTNTTYTPLVSLPGLPNNVPFETDPKINPCPLGKYFNIMIKLFLGICGVLAVVMIVMGGIQYMTSELISSKEEGKKSMTNAILGLLLALGAWLILNTINPDLLNVCLDNVKPVEITIEPESAHEEQVIQTIKSTQTFSRTKYYDTIKTLVGNKFPHCIMQATILIESGGKSSQIIGHDENVKNIHIASRRDFVASGKTFLNSPFDKTNDVKIAKQNDDGKNAGPAPKPTDPKLGLDLRFSHSVGMFGLTFFPPDGHPTDGSSTKMQDVYNNTDNADLKWAIGHLKKGWDSCGGDALKVFKFWGGSCNSTNEFVLMVAGKKNDLYNQCKAQDQ